MAISEKLGDEYGAAKIYHQLGMIAEELRDFVTAGSWYIRGIGIFICYQDQYHLQVARENFMYCYQAASLEEQAKIKALWEQAGLGLFLFSGGDWTFKIEHRPADSRVLKSLLEKLSNILPG